MNPLSQFTYLPPYNEIKPEHIVPAIEESLHQTELQYTDYLEKGVFNWDDFVLPLEALDDRLSAMWGAVEHLHAVMDSSELREAYEKVLPRITEHYTKLTQNKKLYNAYLAVQKSNTFSRYTPAQKRAVEHVIRDCRRAGVTLSPQKKAKLLSLSDRLAKLSNQFEQNALDATDGWHYVVTDRERLTGLPDHVVEAAASLAKQQKEKGYAFSLQAPVYIAVLSYAEDRALRETLYRAYVTRASDQGPCAGKWDNGHVLLEILQIRKDIATLLDFETSAAYYLDKRMAKSVEEVMELLNTLAEHAKPFALKEITELKAYAKKHEDIEHLQPWDLAYYSEKIRLEKFDISQEALRVYFPLDKVLSGMFAIVEKLFGVHIEAAEKDAAHIWHPDVQFFTVTDRAHQTIAYFYIDLFARKGKRSGAWMADCRGRMRLPDGSLQLPVALLQANFTPAATGKPALLTHDEVTTLFHEFGHGLHHMLTTVDVGSVAGMNGVEWDAVELPSQFMENYCWQPETIPLISAHYETGKPLPKRLLNRLIQARQFQAGMSMLRQIEYAVFDMRLHAGTPPTDTTEVQALFDEVRLSYGVTPRCMINRSQNTFLHIFGGGYAAGYYSYKWAEVMSADAFAAFLEAGVLDAKIGSHFLNQILSKGSKAHFDEIYRNFRGRTASIDALLQQEGLVA